MKDKERILMLIITRIIPGLAYCVFRIEDRKKYVESDMLNGIPLAKGDLVYATTSITANDFMVGFVEKVEPDRVVIREIGSKRLCDYYNESFTKINKEKLGYEILEGIEYQIYQKVLKAFYKYTGYWVHFRSIDFVESKCIVTGRNKFESSITGQIEFEFNSKTTIKQIGLLLAEVFKD